MQSSTDLQLASGIRPLARALAAVAACTALVAAPRAQADVIDDIPVGNWYKVPNSNLSSVTPNPAPAGNTGPSSIMIAWSGGAYDSVRDRLIVWGGGHSDYSGNELYVFDLTTLAWSRLTDPSDPSGGSDSSGLYGDGRPRSNHTYSELAFAPNTGKFYYMGLGAVWQSGGYSHRSGAFNFATNSWEDIAAKPSIGLTRSDVTAYDSLTGKIWVAAGEARTMMSYDPVANSWQTYSDWSSQVPAITLYASAAVSPSDKQMVAVGAGQYFVWNLSTPSSASSPTANGNGSVVISQQAPGFAFDSAIGKYVGWAGGATVYTLDPKTLVWTTVPPASGNSVTPTDPPGQGTYGRFQYSPKKNVFVVVNGIDQSVYVYRLSAGTLTTPRPPSSLAAQ
jgi:hypothetical protein